MSRIFISYKRVDKEKVFKIKDLIESALGEKCWIDLDGIESDAQFENVIIKAINECEIVLFMYSKAHTNIKDFDKEWTIRELNFAEKKNKRIVFVNVDGSKLTDKFEFRYGTKQQVDAMSQHSLDRLKTDLSQWLGLKATISPPEPHIYSRKNILYYMGLLVFSILFSVVWMYISGEQEGNYSLSYFAVFVSSITMTILSCVLIKKNSILFNIHPITKTGLLASFIFFSSYSFMALALSFMGVKYVMWNLPSLPFSVMAAIAIMMIMNAKKRGYYLLWISAFALCVGSYWWLSHNLVASMVMIGLSIVLMLLFSLILRIRKDGLSLWKQMK